MAEVISGMRRIPSRSLHGRAGGRYSEAIERATSADRPYLYALLRDPCAYCGEPSTCLDHIQAQSRGGRHHWTNYAGVCSACNGRKRTSSLLGFLGWRMADFGDLARLKRAVEAFVSEQRGWRAVGA